MTLRWMPAIRTLLTKHRRNQRRFSSTSSYDDGEAPTASRENTIRKQNDNLQVAEIEELNEILGSDANWDKKDRALEIEYEFLVYTGEPVPKVITPKMRELLVNVTSSEARKQCWADFYEEEDIESRRQAASKRRVANKMKRIETVTRERLKEKGSRFQGVLYDEHGVSVAGPPPVIIPKVDKVGVVRRHNHNLKFASQFGQPIVLDMGYSTYSTKFSSIQSMQRQVIGLYTANRAHYEPFSVYLRNVSPASLAHRGLLEDNNTADYLWDVSSDSYTSTFPKERLLVLTPDSKDEWKEYKHDDVLVLGAYGRGEKSCRLADAEVKRQGLRTAKLHTNPYFINQRLPDFSLSTMLQIITDARDTNGDWLFAFRRLGGEKSPVKWRTQYHFMKAHSEFKEEEERFQDEHLLQKRDREFVNERTIFKSQSAFLCHDVS